MINCRYDVTGSRQQLFWPDGVPLVDSFVLLRAEDDGHRDGDGDQQAVDERREEKSRNLSPLWPDEGFRQRMTDQVFPIRRQHPDRRRHFRFRRNRKFRAFEKRTEVEFDEIRLLRYFRVQNFFRRLRIFRDQSIENLAQMCQVLTQKEVVKFWRRLWNFCHTLSMALTNLKVSGSNPTVQNDLFKNRALNIR